MHIRVSAPGKLMLFGEHSVVYGNPCIVTAVGQRMYLTIEQIDQKILEINAKQVGVFNYSKDLSKIGKGEIPVGAQYIEIALKKFIEKKQINSGLRVTTKSDFLPELGFGSSSATAVCMIKGLSLLFDPEMSKKEIFDLAYQTHFAIKGMSSGFDIGSAVFGGTIYYSKLGQIIEPLSINPPPIIVGYTGIKASTSALVAQVTKLKEKYPEMIDEVFSNISKLVEKAKTTLLTDDLESMGELMNLNQGFLDVLGVNSLILSKLIYSAREAHAYGAKLSGAGGGDNMIALALNTKRDKVIKAIEKAGGRYIDVKTHVDGVRKE